jgi:hypothetical protein
MSRQPAYQVRRKKKEIDELLAASEQAQLEGKTKFSAMTYEQRPRPVTKLSQLLRSLPIQRKAPGKTAAEPSDTPQPTPDPDPATPCPGSKDPFILPIRR